jgi:hypothetical protein
MVNSYIDTEKEKKKLEITKAQEIFDNLIITIDKVMRWEIMLIMIKEVYQCMKEPYSQPRN